MQLGLKPKFCDVNPTSYVPTVEQLKGVVTPNTKCILIPNLVGNTPDWEAIQDDVLEIVGLSHLDYADLEDDFSEFFQ